MLRFRSLPTQETPHARLPPVVREYARLRALDWPASDAMRAARVRVRFEEAEAEGLVRIRAEPDEEELGTDPLRYSDVHPNLAKKYLAEDEATVLREGVWYYVSEVRREASPTGAWDTADSIGGCVGSIRDSGYDVDLMDAALDALEIQRKIPLPGVWGATCLD